MNANIYLKSVNRARTVRSLLFHVENNAEWIVALHEFDNTEVTGDFIDIIYYFLFIDGESLISV